MLGELAGENKTNGGLDLARGDGRLLVVAREPGRFLSELLEDVVDEAVHDPHGLILPHHHFHHKGKPLYMEVYHLVTPTGMVGSNVKSLAYSVNR